MVLEKIPFVPYRDETERDKDKSKVFTVRLNEEEQGRLNASKRVLQQPKDSTALKMLAEIGYNVLHDQLTGKILETVFKNKDKNERLGIMKVE